MLTVNEKVSHSNAKFALRNFIKHVFTDTRAVFLRNEPLSCKICLIKFDEYNFMNVFLQGESKRMAPLVINQ